MAHEIQKDRLYGNFKDKGLKKKKHKNSSFREDRAGMSEDHLRLIRKLPCVTCPIVPAGTAHHLKCTSERGMGVRSTDQYALPECIKCHDEIERAGAKNEVKYYQDRGITDPLELAEALWKNTGCEARMTAVVIAHKRG